MELLILDKAFSSVATLDVFESFIWTDRYCGYGDFEIYTPANAKMKESLKEEYYIYIKESEHLMIIEDVEIDTDVEDGARMKVTGRSLESILERRIIWNQTVLNGNFQNGIKKLLTENIISPSDESRKISNFVFKESTDTAITSLEVEAQYFGENLYDTIVDLCNSKQVGYKILLDGSNFVFFLYVGTDRSYNQVKNPYVIFSPNFDNLLNSNYVESIKTLKNVTLVAGEGEGSERKTVSVSATENYGTGLSRREIFTDAQGVTKNVNGQEITDEEYTNQLKQKGEETLSKNKKTISFEGEIDSNSTTYKYDEDYFIGDIVQVENEFGYMSRCRITEYVRSQSDSGIETYPTYENV